MRRELLAWLLTIGSMSGVPEVAAQSGASVDGVVKDEQGGVLPGVTVAIRNIENGFERVQVSESDGRYRFLSLQPGTYVLKAELQGFASQEVRDIVLTIGLEVRRDFTMRIQSLSENVTVTGEAPVVDTTKSEVAGVVTQQQIQTLPVNS